MITPLAERVLCTLSCVAPLLEVGVAIWSGPIQLGKSSLGSILLVLIEPVNLSRMGTRLAKPELVGSRSDFLCGNINDGVWPGQ